MKDERDAATRDESGRLAALRRYDVLDTGPEADFDEITRVAAAVCNMDIALVTLVDENRQWFKSKRGVDIAETARHIAFCATAIESDGFMEIPDTTEDERFRTNPLVTGPPYIRFYAGVPLVTPDGYRIGTLCVINRQPAKLTRAQRDTLKLLADNVMDRLELRCLLRESRQARAEASATAAMQGALLTSRQQSERFMRASIDALPDNIAIVNAEGTIIYVNRSWTRFAEDNGGSTLIGATGPGVSYLDVCKNSAAAGSADAALVRDVLQDILAGESSPFAFEYPCHAPGQQRWFEMTITPCIVDDDRHAVIAHRDVTERYAADYANSEQDRAVDKRVRESARSISTRRQPRRASEKRFRAAFDQAQLGGLIIDCDGIIQYANTAVEALTGQSADKLPGSLVFPFVGQEDRAALEVAITRVCDGTSDGEQLMLRMSLPSGSVRWVTANLSPVDIGDETLLAAAILEDITERCAAERQRDRFFEAAIDMMVIADLDGQIYRINPACERILGYTREEMLNTQYVDFAHPDDRDAAKRKIAALGRGEEVSLFDVRMRTKDGKYRDIRWNASPWLEESLFLAVGRDVSSIRTAERAIQEQGEMLARAEQMSQMGSFHWDATNDLVTCSTGLLWIAGLQDDLAPRAIDDVASIFAVEDRDRVRTAIDRAHTKNQSSQQLLKVRRPDGTTRVVQSFFSPGRVRDSGMPGVTAAFRDTTDFSETISRLRESQRELRALTKRMEDVREEERAAFSREIHDELGQMLTALKIDITLLSRDMRSDKKAPPGPSDVVASLGSMEELVNAIIASVRQLAQRMRPEVLDSFGLVPALEWHASEFQRRTDIRCEVTAPAQHPELAPNVRTALFRIVQEAMTNAARHAEANRIDIVMDYADGTVEIAVTDNGLGIPANRLTGTLSLGLLGMRERAVMVGGTFDIRGDEGKGTTVRVSVPVEAPIADSHHNPTTG